MNEAARLIARKIIPEDEKRIDRKDLSIRVGGAFKAAKHEIKAVVRELREEGIIKAVPKRSFFVVRRV